MKGDLLRWERYINQTNFYFFLNSFCTLLIDILFLEKSCQGSSSNRSCAVSMVKVCGTTVSNSSQKIGMAMVAFSVALTAYGATAVCCGEFLFTSIKILSPRRAFIISVVVSG